MWQANLFAPLCNYGFVPARVCGDFWYVDLFLWCYFFGINRTIRDMYAFFVGGVILVVCE
jgi:hypothetical protein